MIYPIQKQSFGHEMWDFRNMNSGGISQWRPKCHRRPESYPEGCFFRRMAGKSSIYPEAYN